MAASALDTAMTQNPAATPNRAMMPPPRKAPRITELIIPMFWSATAGSNRSRGTTAGTSAWNRGVVPAIGTAVQNAQARATGTVIIGVGTSRAVAANRALVDTSNATPKGRGANRSARAPACADSSRAGRPMTTPSTATAGSQSVRSPTSHTNANRLVPMAIAASTLATQMPRKASMRNTDASDGSAAAVSGDGSRVAIR